MAATTLDRNTKKRKIDRQIALDLAAATTIPIGVMVSVATPSVGAVNASDTATHVVMGVSCQRGEYTNGDRRIIVEKGVFLMGNDASITAAHVGQPCYVVDNQTVGLAAGPTNDIIAGYISEVDGEGVWVDMTQAKIAAA